MLQSDVLVVSNRRMSAGAAERMMHAANLKSESEEGMVWLDRIILLGHAREPGRHVRADVEMGQERRAVYKMEVASDFVVPINRK